MKILQINAVYSLLSTGRTCREMQDYINNNTENECRTAFCYGGTERDGYVIGNKLDRKAHGLLSRVSGKQGYFSVCATKKLLSYIDGYRPDIICLRNLHGNYINLPLLFGYIKENQIPVVVTLHDCWFFTGKCMHYTMAGCYKWQKSCGDCPLLKEGNRSWFFDKTRTLLEDKTEFFNSVENLALVGVSDWITNEVKKSPISKNAKEILRIYNWIDTDVFRPREVSNTRKKYGMDDKFVILGAANVWTSGKGLGDFIKLGELLSENQIIVLLGQINANIKLGKNIVNISPTHSVDELVKIYNCADVFVTFSTEETFGKVSAEALSCGLPVICYNSTANPELIGERCGHVAKLGNLQEVKKYIDTVAENGKEKYSDNCVRFARENFNMTECIEQYLKLYGRLIEA